jgi:hypothetical protein
VNTSTRVNLLVMLKTTIVSIFVGGVVVVSAAFPHGLVAGRESSGMPESSAMILFATAMFWIAEVFRRHGKGPRQ